MTPIQLAPVNMHMHTHFSFNADGLSPTQLVEKAVQHRLHATGIVDFDVLDGLHEFYAAANDAGLRAAVGMETRVFFPEYRQQIINSPGEPGVYYFMGMGFARVPPKNSAAGRMLDNLRAGSEKRNRDLTARINTAFPQIAIDYDDDVLPLTPSGNATERHIVRAYIQKVQSIAGSDRATQAAMLGPVLSLKKDRTSALLDDDVALQNSLRTALMKKGGPGYARPDATTFPPIDDVIATVLDADAIPMATWLDGLSDGESDIETQLECLRSKGVSALNIIPDRNWNISDPATRTVKVAKLHETVRIAERMELPINVGTELNSFGQPFVDDFKTEPMRPLWPAFFKGANIMVGQTRLARYAGFSYCGPETEAEFGKERAPKNTFFMAVGMLPCPDRETSMCLDEMDDNRAYAHIRDTVRTSRDSLTL